MAFTYGFEPLALGIPGRLGFEVRSDRILWRRAAQHDVENVGLIPVVEEEKPLTIRFVLLVGPRAHALMIARRIDVVNVCAWRPRAISSLCTGLSR